MKTVVAVAIVAILGTTSCGKEQTQVEQVKEKLNLEGKWAIVSVTTNGTDATTSFTETNGTDYSLQLNQDKTYTICATVKRTTGEEETTSSPTVMDHGTWGIHKIDHESPKTITLDSEVNGYSFNAYTIISNCDNNMSLQQETEGNVNVYKYRKQNQ